MRGRDHSTFMRRAYLDKVVFVAMALTQTDHAAS